MWYPVLAQQEFLAEKKQTAFPLLMFPIHAQSDLSAIDKHSAVFHKFAKLDAGADAQVHLRSVYALASWAARCLREAAVCFSALPVGVGVISAETFCVFS